MTAAAIAHRIALLTQQPAADALLIHEIYRSIQGESTFAGLPCVFVRTAVCDLRCVWCDTPHAFKEGEWLSSTEVLRRVRAFGCPLVEFTGGEPLLQPLTRELMTQLADEGYTVLVETSGAHDIAPLDRRVHIILDLKCPDSGEVAANRWANLEHLKPSDQIKFVIASQQDFTWAVETIRTYRLEGKHELLFSAVFGRIRPVEVVDLLLASGLQRARFQLQMHKYIWDPKARGV